MIVDTEKVSREADGPVSRRVERWSPLGAPQRADGRADQESEDHKRSHNLLYSLKKLLTDFHGPGEINEKAAYIQARSSMARVMEVNGKECQAEGKAKMG